MGQHVHSSLGAEPWRPLTPRSRAPPGVPGPVLVLWTEPRAQAHWAERCHTANPSARPVSLHHPSLPSPEEPAWWPAQSLVADFLLQKVRLKFQCHGGARRSWEAILLLPPACPVAALRDPYEPQVPRERSVASAPLGRGVERRPGRHARLAGVRGHARRWAWGRGRACPCRLAPAPCLPLSSLPPPHPQG